MNTHTQPALVQERLYLRSPQTIRAARHFTRDTLAAWGRASREDDVLLCVSELATNALRYGVPRGRGYLLRLLAYEGTVRVEVHDSGPGLSRIREGVPERGRGLLLVDGLADAWGVLPRAPGKAVWCEFRCR
ncbi:ATP-binding protein [Streptomyces sp. NPDC056773]|uniref:ATP-binding protein n=1 Tax=unclassified Streptomyces TaxID=2593676 RepID=UPI003683C55C